MNENEMRKNIVGTSIILMIIFFVVLNFLASCCTLSFQNILTSGTASDIVDSTPTTDVKSDMNLKIPAM